MIFKKNSLIMVLSNDYENDFTFQITCPSKPLTALRIFKTHYYTHNRDLLLSVGSVESGNQADAMVADDHNPRRVLAMETLIPSNHDLCLRLALTFYMFSNTTVMIDS